MEKEGGGTKNNNSCNKRNKIKDHYVCSIKRNGLYKRQNEKRGGFFSSIYLSASQKHIIVDMLIRLTTRLSSSIVV